MPKATISIEVDADVANAYAQAPAAQQQKLQLLLDLRLRELVLRPPRSLAEIMDEIGTQAEASGLTAEVLESLLRDE